LITPYTYAAMWFCAFAVGCVSAIANEQHTRNGTFIASIKIENGIGCGVLWG